MATTYVVHKIDIDEGGPAIVLTADIDLGISETFYIPEETAGIRVAGLKERRIYPAWAKTGGAGTLLVSADWLNENGDVILTQNLTDVDVAYPVCERVRFKAVETGASATVQGRLTIRIA